MEGMVELDVDATIAEMVSQKNMKIGARKKVGQGRKKKAQSVAEDKENLPGSVEGQNDNGPSGTAVLVFDYSVENHFRAIDRICKLCGEAEYHDLGKSEIERLSFSITFLREWRHFNYQPRVVQFACQSESSPQGKDAIDTITLPQFSAATVPQKDVQNGNMISPGSNKDFVLYTGGSIWALDWCPRIHQRSDNHIKCEFIAVAAHPPESSYHKIGAPLIGRGVIQIWCVLSVGSKEEEASLMKKKPNKYTRNSTTVKVKSPKPKKPRGRPRKEPVHETVVNSDGDNECAQALEIVKVESLKLKKPRGRPRKNPVNENVVNLNGDNECVQSLEIVRVESPKLKKRRGRPAKKPVNETVVNLDGNNECEESLEIVKVESPKLKKPRGRPAKKPVNETVVNLDGDNECVQALAVQFPGNSTTSLPVDIVSMDTQEPVAKRDSGWKRNGGNGVLSVCDSVLTSVKRRRLKDKAGEGNYTRCDDVPLLTQNDNRECSPVNSIASLNSEQDPKNGSSESSTARCLIPKDVALPRVVLCLAHNGKVAWDVKWRPSNVHDTESKYRMGYLAVLLGNGALEVWDVPLPQTMNAIYSACQKEGTDPRFVKLEPIFRCSKLKCGGRQSIPLTVEWSASSPHDFILAGCHDGVVALWKFSASATSEATDTRPLLCFSADTVPIRALAWAPVESDSESANVIVTAGHKGLKFWDIRDPFRPLWDLNPVQRNIYSLDWLPDPRCVIVSFDDGTLRILSLVKAAYDVPVTGKPFVGTQQQGFHSYYCSSFAIWNVHVSRLTGMVAYCSADGTVLRFQLTARAVEKDPLRNRVPHFLCGSLSEEESTLTVITPLPDIPFPMKKSLNEWSNAPRTIRGFLSESNQAKRAKEQMTKDQTSDGQNLALCYDDDPGIEIESEDALDSPKSQRPPKSKTTSKKKSKVDQALACRDEEEQENIEVDGEKGEVRDEIDVFPPKIVAMHRVRWNMNKGSERWLCYGGASGIVRCQEV